jgi:hypothetical protein
VHAALEVQRTESQAKLDAMEIEQEELKTERGAHAPVWHCANFPAQRLASVSRVHFAGVLLGIGSVFHRVVYSLRLTRAIAGPMDASASKSSRWNDIDQKRSKLNKVRAHPSLPVRYVMHAPCVFYREGCLHAHARTHARTHPSL